MGRETPGQRVDAPRAAGLPPAASTDLTRRVGVRDGKLPVDAVSAFTPSQSGAPNHPAARGGVVRGATFPGGEQPLALGTPYRKGQEQVTLVALAADPPSDASQGDPDQSGRGDAPQGAHPGDPHPGGMGSGHGGGNIENTGLADPGDDREQEPREPFWPTINPQGILRNELLTGYRDAIQTGRILPGDKLPTQTAMMVYYGISRTTAQTLIRDLQKDGLVVSYTRIGTTVREPGQKTPIDLHSLNAGPQILEDLETDVSHQRVGIRQPNPTEIATFGIDPRTTAMVSSDREQRDSSGNLLYVTQHTRPVGTQEITGITAAAIAPPDYAANETTIGARMPTVEEVNQFRLPPGVPVLEINTTHLGEDGNPIVLTKSILRADRNLLQSSF